MKFSPTAVHRYWWPIKINLPHPERSGQWLPQTFDMEFISVNADEAKELAREISEIQDDAERNSREHDQLLKVSVNWRGVIDEDADGKKVEVPFSPEMLLAMMKAGPWYRLGIYLSWNQSLLGGARKGN